MDDAKGEATNLTTLGCCASLILQLRGALTAEFPAKTGVQLRWLRKTPSTGTKPAGNRAAQLKAEALERLRLILSMPPPAPHHQRCLSWKKHHSERDADVKFMADLFLGFPGIPKGSAGRCKLEPISFSCRAPPLRRPPHAAIAAVTALYRQILGNEWLTKQATRWRVTFPGDLAIRFGF